MAQSRAEISHYVDFDYVVVNEQFDEALRQLMAIVQAERVKTRRQKIQHNLLIKELLAEG